MNKEKFAHTKNIRYGEIRKGKGQTRMRSNARFYLYIGAGAIAIVILTAWLVAVVNNSRGNSEDGNTAVEKNQNTDQTGNKDQADNKGQTDHNGDGTNHGGTGHQDVLDVPVDDDPMVDVSNGDLDYLPDKNDLQIPVDNESKNPEETDEETPGESVDVSAKTYTFHAGSILQWPVQGNVIINYSMDKMIYFETLDAYKYHPAICIQAEEGTKVVAGATGEVISVTNEPDTGLTVGMRIGSEYVIYYGNLKDCTLKVGDHVNRGEEIGKVSQPTKYFTIEGCHLHLRLERNEEPVNPLSYLDYSN